MSPEFDTEKGDDLETIRQRLTEAATWLGIAGKLTDSEFPRTTDLHPRHLEPNRKEEVASVAMKRNWGIRDNRAAPPSRIEGRLLGYSPDETVWDGASEGATAGFFDVEDAPPWDFWLAYVVESGDQSRDYLVCWIPPAFVETAEIGIDVNPVGCD
jgi:hypothetical protein